MEKYPQQFTESGLLCVNVLCTGRTGCTGVDLYCRPVPGELLSQPRPDSLTEIICPKNGSERVDVALVYPPTPTATSPK